MSGIPVLQRHVLSRTPEYKAWQQMRLRCKDPKHKAYASYGRRGIAVCERWLNSVASFVADMGPKPSPSHEIDRIDNNGGYEPANCRWATRKVNDRNRRNNRLIEFRGETLALAEWCERFGLPSDTVRKRLFAGWTTEQALTTPLIATGRRTDPAWIEANAPPEFYRREERRVA